MADNEKVWKGLERCLSGKVPFGCGKCPYYGDEKYSDACSCRLSLMHDAEELLKIQRAIIQSLHGQVHDLEEEVRMGTDSYWE